MYSRIHIRCFEQTTHFYKNISTLIQLTTTGCLITAFSTEQHGPWECYLKGIDMFILQDVSSLLSLTEQHGPWEVLLVRSIRKSIAIFKQDVSSLLS